MPSWLWRSSAQAFAITALTLTTPPIANTQTEEQKFPGKIVCGAFSGDARKYPAWNDEMQISINRGRLIATPSRPQGQAVAHESHLLGSALRMALSPTASGLAAIYDGATRTEATKMAALVIEVRVWLRRSPNVEATSS
jgi:hypothetical protein